MRPATSESRQFDNFYRRKQTDVGFECVCLVVENESRHNIVRVVCESIRSLIFSFNNAILNWAKLRKRSNVPKGPLAKNNFPLTQLPFVCSTWRFITANASSAKHEWRSGSQIRKNTTPLVCKGLIALEMNKRPEKIIRQTKVGHGMVQP